LSFTTTSCGSSAAIAVSSCTIARSPRRALDGIEVSRISQPADRLIIEIADCAQVNEALISV